MKLAKIIKHFRIDKPEKFKLADRGTHMVRTLSGGMMQRLSIARAMMHDPEVLFLDEPSAGLDPQTRLLLWETIREYHRSGKTIVLTTHDHSANNELAEVSVSMRENLHEAPDDLPRLSSAVSWRLHIRARASARANRFLGRISTRSAGRS